MTVPDPATLMAEIHGIALTLDQGSKELSRAIRDLAEVEPLYERAFHGELIRILDEARRDGQRPPAEDLRKALAHEAVDPEVYARYLKTKAAVDAGRAWLRASEAGLSARQSLLSALKAEGGAQRYGAPEVRS